MEYSHHGYNNQWFKLLLGLSPFSRNPISHLGRKANKAGYATEPMSSKIVHLTEDYFRWTFSCALPWLMYTRIFNQCFTLPLLAITTTNKARKTSYSSLPYKLHLLRELCLQAIHQSCNTLYQPRIRQTRGVVFLPSYVFATRRNSRQPSGNTWKGRKSFQ